MPLVQDFTMREGATERKYFQLTYGNGRPRDLTGVSSISLIVIASDGTGTRTAYISTGASPKTGIESATIGRVWWDPAAADLAAASSPYHYMWIVTVDTDTVEYYPEDKIIKITVLDDYICQHQH